MDIIVYASFKNASTTLGEIGLVPIVTGWSILKVSPYTKIEIVSAQNATEIGRGLYYYVITGADLETYEYPAVALTNGVHADVIDAEVHMLKYNGAEAYATEMARITAAVATETKQDVIDSNVDAILADTSTTLPATLAGLPQDVWEYYLRTLTMSQDEILAIQTGSDIAVLRGDTLSVPITGLGDLTDADKLYVTVRKVQSVGDSESAIQVEKTAKLLYLNGASPVLPIVNTDADLVVDDATDGDITFSMKPVASTELRANTYFYDVQKITSGGVTTTMRIGSWTIAQDVTRAVT